ncbi:RNA 2',3'-cyclic phosphodiesterase [Candidatus Woesearchaeota archaeon]|nr:RNA 2',3'-cyclic phosphodiesterase [Candidatus Woesearchaeota archaeon]
MRLFVAIDFPDALKLYLGAVGERLKSDSAIVAVAQQYHLTLKFLGEYPEDKIQDLERRLSNVIFRPFKGRLSQIGTFGEGYETRVVWGGVEPVESFIKLAEEIDKLTPEVKKDYPDYSPHVTFARVKRIRALTAFLDLVNGVRLEPREFYVQEFKLIRSIGGEEGHRYETLRAFPAKSL